METHKKNNESLQSKLVDLKPHFFPWLFPWHLITFNCIQLLHASRDCGDTRRHPLPRPPGRAAACVPRGTRSTAHHFIRIKIIALACALSKRGGSLSKWAKVVRWVVRKSPPPKQKKIRPNRFESEILWFTFGSFSRWGCAMELG